MTLEVFDDEPAVAREAAGFIARQARAAVAARGRFALAVSGGSTPWKMLRELARESIPWRAVDLFQVDERVAPDGHPARNLTHLTDCLLAAPDAQLGRVHAMRVDRPDLQEAAADYARLLHATLGVPPILDLVHLGLGGDGHTASLVPGDPVVDVQDADVAVTHAVYQGHRRMTLTLPAINRARTILWLVCGSAKADVLGRLHAGDAAIPAGRVKRADAVVIADRAAAASVASAGSASGASTSD